VCCVGSIGAVNSAVCETREDRRRCENARINAERRAFARRSRKQVYECVTAIVPQFWYLSKFSIPQPKVRLRKRTGRPLIKDITSYSWFSSCPNIHARGGPVSSSFGFREPGIQLLRFVGFSFVDELVELGAVGVSCPTEDDWPIVMVGVVGRLLYCRLPLRELEGDAFHVSTPSAPNDGGSGRSSSLAVSGYGPATGAKGGCSGTGAAMPSEGVLWSFFDLAEGAGDLLRAEAGCRCALIDTERACFGSVAAGL